MKYFIISLLIFGLLSCKQNQTQQNVESNNENEQQLVFSDSMKALMIGEWEGSITYVDYQSNEPFSMLADLVVSKPDTGNDLIMHHIYPNEPQANSIDTLRFNSSNTTIDHQPIESITMLNNQTIIKTIGEGMDNNQLASIRYAYECSDTQFTVTKMVQFHPDSNWIERNQFDYTKKR